MDSDDEELAQMRAARAAATGQTTLTDLKRRAAASAQCGDTGGDDDPMVVFDGVEAGGGPPVNPLQDMGLPLAFGKKEEPQHRAALYGPPRPPGKQQQPAFGPPRPPAAVQAADAAAPQRPTGGWMTAADVIGSPCPGAGSSARDNDGADDADAREGARAGVGPPRPQPPPAGGDGQAGDSVEVGPPRPPKGSDDDDDDDDDSDDGEPDDPYRLPITNEVVLQGQQRAVTCLSCDPAGSRLLTGSLDFSVRMFDFAGMKRDLRSFRELTPSDGHPLNALSWSPSGDAFLAVLSSAQPRVYDREGVLRGECVRGDPYIRDMKNTKGHVSGCTGGMWHPTDRFTAATCSDDGTVRIWDTHNVLQKTVVKPSNPSAARVGVTSVAYNATGKLLAAGLVDGTLQVWGVGGKFGTSAAVGVVLPPAPQMVEKQGWTYVSRPNQLLRGAHEPQNEITSVAFSKDDVLMASRGMDGTLRLWDLRRFKAPLMVWSGLDTNYANTTCCFSPDERLLLTGIAAERRGPAVGAGGAGSEGGGALVMFDVKEMREVRRVGMPAHVAAIQWHPRINQIFVGVGDKRGGAAHVLYDGTYSQRGALMAVHKAPRAPNPFDIGVNLALYEVPLTREGGGGKKRQREKMRQDALNSRKPDPGATAGVGRSGRLGATGGTLLTQHLLKQRGGLKSTAAELDPREAILRHANKDDEISRLTDAYAKTQPQAIFAQADEDEEDEEE